MPVDINNFSSLELVNSDVMDQKTYYVSSYELKLECFIRDLSNMQKRERPNRYSINFSVKDDKGCSQIQTVEEFTVIPETPSKNNPIPEN
jgi:hypothetical protein